MPDDGVGEGLAFLKDGQPRGEVARDLGPSEQLLGFEQGVTQGLEEGPRADDPGGDSVDAGVEEVEAEMGAREVVAPDKLVGDGLGFVVEDDDVVGVPANTPADVEEDLIDPAEDGGELVGDGFGGVEVSGVETEQGVVLDGVAEVELVGPDDVAFGAEAEEFAFDGVKVVGGVEGFGEDRVERLLQALAGALGGRRAYPSNRRESRRS